MTSCEVHDVDRCVDRRGRQDHRRDEDRRQDRLHQERRRDRRGVHQDHQVHQDEDQNQDVLQGHQDHRDEDRQGQDGIRQGHRGVRHQDRDELQGHRDGRQDQDGNHLDLDEMYQEPCADQVAAGCADLLKKQDQEVAEWEDGLQGDAHQAACREAFRLVACLEATGHVQRGALGVSLEAD